MHGVKGIGARQNTHQGRRLRQGQIAGGLSEVKLRRILKAVEVFAQIHPVEVSEQQVVFAVEGLQLEGGDRLANFAPRRVFGTHILAVNAAGQLLGDGAPPLANAASLKIHQDRSQNPEGVDPQVPVVAGVLRGHQGLGQVGRKLPDAAQLLVRLVALLLERHGGAIVLTIDHHRPLHRVGQGPHGNFGPLHPDDPGSHHQGQPGKAVEGVASGLNVPGGRLVKP